MVSQAIWLIAGGPMQVHAAQQIKKRGYALILSDGNPDAICRNLADEFVCLNTFDCDGHLKALSELSKKYDIRSVLTLAADCHYTVAVLKEALGLPHVPPEISRICRNKNLTREVLQNAGLRQPWSTTTGSFEEAYAAVAQADSDVVIKATDSSGSRGFQVIPKGQMLTREQFEYSRSQGTTGQVVIEGRLVPVPDQISESSVETIWYKGKMYWFNWVDRIFGRDLNKFPQLKKEYGSVADGIEVGHINPARHDDQTKSAVYREMQKAGLALGLDKVDSALVLKGDIFLTPDGPVILELTPRCSGGWDSSASTLARGADLQQGLIELSLGKPLDLDLWDAYFQFRNVEKISVVLSDIPQNAVDCIGRKFAIAAGTGSIEGLIADVINKKARGEYIVPNL